MPIPLNLQVNVANGAPGSSFIFTASSLMASEQVLVSVRFSLSDQAAELARLSVPADGLLIFMLDTSDSTPLGRYTIRVGAWEQSIVLDRAAPLRRERPADVPVVPLQITYRTYLPVLVR